MGRLFWTFIILWMILEVLARSTAQAEPLKYEGTPFFYSGYAKPVYDCSYDDTSRYGACADKTYPDDGIVALTDGSTRVVQFYNEVVCLDGTCQTNYNEPVGLADIKGVSYWYVPVGYYLKTGSDGVVKAYRQGTGPLATTYKMSPTIPDDYSTPVVDGNVVGPDEYNAYCNRVGQCKYMGMVVSFDTLKTYIPKVLTHRCDPNLCYNPNNTVAGINPKGN